MAKKIIIDTDLCEGCETCVEMCPEVFELGEDGKARVKNQDACNTCDCQEAMDLPQRVFNCWAGKARHDACRIEKYLSCSR